MATTNTYRERALEALGTVFHDDPHALGAALAGWDEDDLVQLAMDADALRRSAWSTFESRKGVRR